MLELAFNPPQFRLGRSAFGGAFFLDIENLIQCGNQLLVGVLERFHVHHTALGLPGGFDGTHLQHVGVLLQKLVGHVGDGALGGSGLTAVLHAQGRQATAAQNAVTEMTNDLLKKNADTLKMGTIATAKEAERSIIDIETLQHTNQQLISTLDEVLNIQKEGAAKRKEAEVELGKIEGELKQKLMELRS